MSKKDELLEDLDEQSPALPQASLS